MGNNSYLVFIDMKECKYTYHDESKSFIHKTNNDFSGDDLQCYTSFSYNCFIKGFELSEYDKFTSHLVQIFTN